MADKIRRFVDAESEKALNLAFLNDLEALNQTVFGMPAWYLRQLEGIDAPALHIADRKPAMFLWGEQDRQVYDKDWALWQERLSGHPDAVFKSYPHLNHLFGEYKGAPVAFAQLVSVEYAAKSPVSADVIDDISAWLSAHS
jgi:pimeloyl-ACP methyl ester carboxylesterase